MQRENQLLKIKLSDIEELCQMSSTKMEASINFLQEEMHKLSKQTSTNVNNNIENCNNAIIGDDVILLALAGLKQVKLIFNQANQMFNTCFF